MQLLFVISHLSLRINNKLFVLHLNLTMKPNANKMYNAFRYFLPSIYYSIPVSRYNMAKLCYTSSQVKSSYILFPHLKYNVTDFKQHIVTICKESKW